MENILFEDVFDVQKKDPDGKKFDKGASVRMRLSTGREQPQAVRSVQIARPPVRRAVSPAVSRFVLKSDLFEFEATLDINIDIFPLKVRQRARRRRLGGRCAAELRRSRGSLLLPQRLRGARGAAPPRRVLLNAQAWRTARAAPKHGPSGWREGDALPGTHDPQRRHRGDRQVRQGGRDPGITANPAGPPGIPWQRDMALSLCGAAARRRSRGGLGTPRVPLLRAGRRRAAHCSTPSAPAELPQHSVKGDTAGQLRLCDVRQGAQQAGQGRQAGREAANLMDGPLVAPAGPAPAAADLCRYRLPAGIMQPTPSAAHVAHHPRNPSQPLIHYRAPPRAPGVQVWRQQQRRRPRQAGDLLQLRRPADAPGGRPVAPQEGGGRHRALPAHAPTLGGRAPRGAESATTRPRGARGCCSWRRGQSPACPPPVGKRGAQALAARGAIAGASPRAGSRPLQPPPSFACLSTPFGCSVHCMPRASSPRRPARLPG